MEIVRPEDRIFLNADFDGFVQLRSLSRDFGGKIHAVKFGMGFLKAAIDNPRVAGTHRILKAQGIEMFLDSKFHEDADQMDYVVRKYEGSGDDPDFSYISVTAAAEKDSLKAAKLAANKMRIVTSLSSSSSKFFGLEIDNLLEANSELEEPIEFVMCNAADTERIKSVGDFTVIATGIRLPGQVMDDHPAIMTPAEAVAANADYISIGRAAGEDRVAGVQKVLENMRSTA